jgi:membrane associated rhomboid family serine protease
VLGAYLLLFPRSKVTVLVPIFIFPLFFDLPALLFLGIWFLEQLWAGTLWSLSPLAARAGGVAWWAHVGGFLAGAVLVVTFVMQMVRERERRSVRRDYAASR